MTHSGGETNRQHQHRTDSPTAGARREAVHFEKERGVTEIRILRPVAHITAQLEKSDLGSGRLHVLQSLAASNVPVFLVKLLPDGLSFAVRGENVETCQRALDEASVTYSLQVDLAVVTTIAGAMRDLSGVMASIYEALNDAGIRVQQTGDAYNAVLCLVEGTLSEQAAQVLRKQFTLEKSGAEQENVPSQPDENSGKIEGVPGTGLQAL